MDIVICDDETLARERLSRVLTRLGHTVVGQAKDGIEAIELVEEYQPDVIFLDIRMPRMDGLSCATQLSELETPPAIIFCTAFDQYAIEAFQTHAIAYLLKPIAESDLQQALQKATKLNQAQVQALPSSQAESIPQRQHIMAKSHRGVELIDAKNIYYFFADQKYVVVRHKTGEVLIDETLKELEYEFKQDFIRIHRNALISIRYLDGLEMLNNGQYQVRIKEIGTTLLISRRHLSVLKERLKRL